MKQNIIHKLVGYHAKTGRMVYEHDVPQGVLRLVKDIANVARDDPDAIGSYRLSPRQAREIASVLNLELPQELSFSLEPFDLDWGKKPPELGITN